DVIRKNIYVRSIPSAQFEIIQQNGLTGKFKCSSSQAYRCDWDFGDGSPIVSGFQPEHLFRDTGMLNVKLITYNGGGCSDTAVERIHISKNKAFVVNHNIITPNGDGFNETFDVDLRGHEYYQLIIRDKDGKVVFETNDQAHSWNGTYQNSGSPCPLGTYIYQVQYRYSGESRLYRDGGTITLER
nr:gliding motility-associated C-terminal domain-containing protein [Bacteroidota bacterium]